MQRHKEARRDQMKILLINPNTTELVTHRAAGAARMATAPGTIIEGVTGHFGAPIINSLTDNAIGTYCAIELAAQHAINYDAVILAVSFDSGLFELREMLSIPVAGMSESAMRQAAKIGQRFSLISFGHRTKLMYEQLAQRYGMSDRLASVRCIETLSDEQMADLDFLIDRVGRELRFAHSEDEADSAVLSATVFAGLANRFNDDIPVIDGITAAVREIQSQQGDLPTLSSNRFPEPKQLKNVPYALNKLYSSFSPSDC